MEVKFNVRTLCNGYVIKIKSEKGIIEKCYRSLLELRLDLGETLLQELGGTDETTQPKLPFLRGVDTDNSKPNDFI